MIDIPKAPELGQELPPNLPSQETLSLLSSRRSTTAAILTEPGPAPALLDELLRVASRVPDHRRVVPFRFILFEGETRQALGEVLADAAAASSGEDRPAPDVARTLAVRAPTIVFVISSVNTSHKTPEWEQILTAGAVCQTLLIAASAAGFAGQWLSEWIAYDTVVRERLNLSDSERIAGVVYLGTASEPPKERARPNVPALISRWSTS